MKEMMNGGSTRQKQLKDNLNVFPREVVEKYNFFVQLFAIVR